MSNTHRHSVHRRGFLKGLAGLGLATAGPLALPSHLFGAQAPSKRIHLLMIGTGRQGIHVNLHTFLHMPEVRIVGVCDVDRWRAEQALERVYERYGDKDCKRFTDFREALEMDGLDAVMDSTADHWHAGVSLAAIAKGLHCCTEKPLTRYLAEGRALANAASAKGIVFRTDTECRSHAYMNRIATLARNGYLGEIRRIEVGVPRADTPGGDPNPAPVPDGLDYELWLGPAPRKEYVRDRVHPVRDLGRPGWMRYLDYCEGMVTNWGTHLIDVAQLANDTERTGPVSVEGEGTYPDPDSGVWNVLTDFKLHYRYASGVTLDYKTDVPYLRVEGEEGWIQGNWHSPGGLTASDNRFLRFRPAESDIRIPQRADKEDFVYCIRNNAPEESMIDAEVGHRTNAMCQIGHIAIMRGKRLEWDPYREQFSNDPKANQLLDYRERRTGYELPA